MTKLNIKDLETAIKTLKLERNLLVYSCLNCLVHGGICNKCQIFYFDPDRVQKIKGLRG